MGDLNTHGFKMETGRHKGELITRVPVGYLKWMVREKARNWAWAAAELERRGTVTPDIEVSGHAIDSASLRCRRIWHETRRDENEGLHAWLCRMAGEALNAGEKRGDKVAYNGMLFVFADEGQWPLLKTIMREKGGQHAATEREEVLVDA